jgi:hypothetical protein
MNYIYHLSKFYRLLDEDPRVKPLHISLYMALFQTWNHNFFTHSFIMGRTRLMQLSRIGSKTTFSKMLRELHDFGYIIYEPSGYTAKKPMITMVPYHEMDSPCPGTGTDPVHAMNSPGPETVTDPVPKVGHIDKRLETNINNAISVCVPHTPHTQIDPPSKVRKKTEPPTKEEVIQWFTEKQASLEIASTFYHHYRAIGWKLGRNGIKEWQAAAEKWILSTKKTTDHGSSQYLHTDNYKNFGEPL